MRLPPKSTAKLMIEIDSPRLLPHLLVRLRAAGLSVQAVGSHEGRVFDPGAEDPDEALCELRFFVAAWARAHGNVGARVRPAG